MSGYRKIGFTLIELICVLAVIAIIVALPSPVIDRMSGEEGLRMETKGLVNDLRYAKMYAITRNITSVYVRFIGRGYDGTFSGYKVYYPNNTANPLLKEKSLYKGIVVDGWNSTFSTGTTDDLIEFKADGSVYPACTIVLKRVDGGEVRKITLTIGYTRVMEKE